MKNKEILLEMVEELRVRYNELHNTRDDILLKVDDIEKFINNNF